MMNTYASQHPADKTPLYEPVHATVGCESWLKRVLLRGRATHFMTRWEGLQPEFHAIRPRVKTHC